MAMSIARSSRIRQVRPFLRLHVCFLLSSLLFSFDICIFPRATALIVTRPSGIADYQQLASLLVSTFDEPHVTSSCNSSPDQKERFQSKIESMKWNLYERYLTEQAIYKQYTNTMKRLWDKKYCLFVAKELIQVNEGNGSRSNYEVVGMAEMGISFAPVPLNEAEITQDNISMGTNQVPRDIEDAMKGEDLDSSTNNMIGLRPRATVGVLCVKSNFQKKGVGQALLQKCEEVASDVWAEQSVYVDVEPSNVNALSFFEHCGYSGFVDETGNMYMRNATVSERRTTNSVPHFVLKKTLCMNNAVNEEYAHNGIVSPEG
jgi:ribosomal protein S18 acetylase RimI-like enzyme